MKSLKKVMRESIEKGVGQIKKDWPELEDLSESYVLGVVLEEMGTNIELDLPVMREVDRIFCEVGAAMMEKTETKEQKETDNGER